MQILKSPIVFVFISLLFCQLAVGQDTTRLRLFEPSPEFHPQRFWTSLGIGSAVYATSMVGLSRVWYSEYEQTSFHFFNDSREWKGMDKAGHIFTAYFESNWAFRGALWTGVPRRKAMWLGVGLGSLLQASIETLDGFSDKWGFSIPDIAFNTIGVSAFAAQEMIWQEQRITFKVSSHPTSYPDVAVFTADGGQSMLLSERADDLYGGDYAATFLKDYNAMTIWASFNINSFLPNNHPDWLPPWLNIALGYGAQNLYGGFENEWEVNGQTFILPNDTYPRYQQFFLSFDVDLARIRTKNRFVRMLLFTLNNFKIPGPALEINTNNGLRFRPFYF